MAPLGPASEEGADWLVEVLEYEREFASAQLAFALEDFERKTSTTEERRPRKQPHASPGTLPLTTIFRGLIRLRKPTP